MTFPVQNKYKEAANLPKYQQISKFISSLEQNYFDLFAWDTLSIENF